MKRSLVGLAVAFDVIALLALLGIAVWCTWHPGLAGEGVEAQVVYTWFWLGLVPGTLGTAAVAMWYA